MDRREAQQASQRALDPNRDVYALAKELVRACHRKGICLTGFLYNMEQEPPLFMHISTITTEGPDLTALHLKLCDLLDSSKVTRVQENIKP